jgi:hypothetical protein
MAIRPITDTLRKIGRGAFLDTISAELADLVRQVEEHGKAGTLVLRIKVSKAGRAGALVIEGKHELQMPKPPAEDALLWATPEGNLVDSDPNQKQLDLQSVPLSSGQLQSAA